MSDVKSYIQNLFTAKGIAVEKSKTLLFEEFAESRGSEDAVLTIMEKQNYLMDQWALKNRIADILALPVVIPNATERREYTAKIDLTQLGLSDLVVLDWQGLEEIGLKYDQETHSIEGTPNQSGDFKLVLRFRVRGYEASSSSEKVLSLIVNPDPKTLWRTIPSDKEAIFWKDDDVCAFGKLGNKHIVVASNRGRSHENNGSFREDDFAFKFMKNTGWSIVAVSDGAGSYPLSRKGSQLACHSIVEYFENQLDPTYFIELDGKFLDFEESKNEVLLRGIEVDIKQKMYRSVLFAHNQIKAVAEATFKSNPEFFNNPKAKSLLEYFHATLIFVLFKKFDFGYVILTFGVGDCPIAVVNKDKTQSTLLNTLDVGEFGGGTRFLTQHDIYHLEARPIPMADRFNMHITTDFSYLFLMTDGIYDAKFTVEANLERHEKWIAFLEDLQGQNEDHISVNLNPHNENIANELAHWMDFWSPGNHDDRTLAIIF